MNRKRLLPLVSLAFFLLAPFTANAYSVLVWNTSLGGWAANGGEQTDEANRISAGLTSLGVNGGVSGASDYRNSYYRFTATGGAFFTLGTTNVGATMTIVHRKDWVGVASNLCARQGSGYEDGTTIDDSDCAYVATWGRYSQTLALNLTRVPCTVSNSCGMSNAGVIINGVCSTEPPQVTSVINTRSLTPSGHYLGTYDDFRAGYEGTICRLLVDPTLITLQANVCAPDLNIGTPCVLAKSGCEPGTGISEYYAESRHNRTWGAFTSGQGVCPMTGIEQVTCITPAPTTGTVVTAPPESSCPAPSSLPPPSPPEPTPYWDVTAGATTVSPSPTIAGQSATLTARITNLGTASVRDVPNAFQIGTNISASGVPATLVARFSATSPAKISYLGGGGNYYADVSASYLFATPGTYAVRACANIVAATWSWGLVGAYIPESDYDNNCGAWTEVTVSSTSNPPTPISPTPPTPTLDDACGTASDATKPLNASPGGTAACAHGAYANSPPDTALAWNWSCGTVTTCSAPKYGCTTATDTNYNATGPDNVYGCKLTCKNGAPVSSYPTCGKPACTSGGPPCCAPQ